MLKSKKSAILFIILWVVAFYSWVIIFWQNDTMRLLGATTFPIVGGAVSLLWLYRGYRTETGTQRMYKRLLVAGMLLYVLSNVIWFSIQIPLGYGVYPQLLHLLWLGSYILFLSALFYKYSVLHKNFRTRSYFYNIYIFMVVAFSISMYYLIQPILHISNESVFLAYVNLAYTVVDLVIVFMAINIYYLTRDSSEQLLSMYIAIGFTVQVLSDILYAHLISTGQYKPGSFMDPLWVLAILIIGLAGLYGRNNKNLRHEIISHEQQHMNDDGPLLNVSVLILVLIIVHENNWNWNPLYLGLIATIILIISRQIAVIRQNHTLLDELSHQAYSDLLTGVANRASFEQDMKLLIKKAEERNEQFSIFLIDLDRFKYVNETHGHVIGDGLLIQCSQIMKNLVGEKNEIYRVGGNEFVIILPNSNEEECKAFAEAILNCFKEPIQVANYKIPITPSIGISIFPIDGTRYEDLLKIANITMYQAKHKGLNNYSFYDSNVHKTISRNMEIEQGLREAIALNQFSISYQPKIQLSNRQVVGMEALLRWKHPGMGIISPGEFISIAEKTGQIIPIGEWVLRTVCKQTKEWVDQGLTVCVAVNVSVKQLQYTNFTEKVNRICEEVGLDHRYIELEITESVIQDSTESFQVLKELKELGFKLAIDDFGTGYSSLSVLNEMPIDALKIDKSFIDHLANDREQAILNSIIDIGHYLNLEIVIEGIEEEEQIELLGERKHLIIGQGYLFGKPMSAEEVIKSLYTYKV